MTVTVDVNEFVVNAGNLAFNQLNAKTQALPDGDYVVVWQDSNAASAPIRMQRYDAQGNAVGAQVVTGLTGTVMDIGLNPAGDIALAFALGTQMSVRFYAADDLAVLGTSTSNFGSAPNSAQIDPNVGDAVRVVFTLADGTLVRAIASPALAVLGSPAAIVALTAGTTVLETVGTSSSAVQFSLLSNGLVIDTSGTNISGGPLATATDILLLQPGLYVATSVVGVAVNPTLTALFGNVTSAATLAVGANVLGAAVPGTGAGSGATITAREMVNLGEGRILLVWAAFAGSPTSTLPGIYASVYDATNGTIEGEATLLRAIGGPLANLQGVTLLATMLADGRVAVTYSAPNGLAGSDVFSVIVDARNGGVTVSGSGSADRYVGTSFDDSFASINFNDTIFGGAGIDSVTLSGSNPRTVDLANPDAFVGQGPVLDGVENLTGTSAVDIFYGNAVANRLDGGNGNDLLVGRAGDDNLLGGAGDDTLDGGTGDDRIDGGGNNDVLFGRDGNDSVYGGLGDDQVQGGTGDDLIQGGDGNDVLNGGTGNDTLLGGIGNDTIVTGTGDDLVQAGDGADLIHLGTGANTILGEGGLDTVSFARLPVGSQGPVVHADLAGIVDPLAAAFGFEEPFANLVGVENLIGSGAGDFLAGDGAANRLSGGAGDDVLVGRAGADTLTGGEGADTFVFNAPADGADAVRDYTVGVDVVALVLGGFGDIDAGNIATRFVPSAAPSPAANSSAQLLFDNSGAGAGRLLFDADGNGAGVAVLVATLTFATPGGLAAFGAGDFIFV